MTDIVFKNVTSTKGVHLLASFLDRQNSFLNLERDDILSFIENLLELPDSFYENFLEVLENLRRRSHEEKQVLNLEKTREKGGTVEGYND